jgi:hypothetical protein
VARIKHKEALGLEVRRGKPPIGKNDPELVFGQRHKTANLGRLALRQEAAPRPDNVLFSRLNRNPSALQPFGNGTRSIASRKRVEDKIPRNGKELDEKLRKTNRHPRGMDRKAPLPAIFLVIIGGCRVR